MSGSSRTDTFVMGGRWPYSCCFYCIFLISYLVLSLFFFIFFVNKVSLKKDFKPKLSFAPSDYPDVTEANPQITFISMAFEDHKSIMNIVK